MITRALAGLQRCMMTSKRPRWEEANAPPTAIHSPNHLTCNNFIHHTCDSGAVALSSSACWTICSSSRRCFSPAYLSSGVRQRSG